MKIRNPHYKELKIENPYPKKCRNDLDFLRKVRISACTILDRPCRLDFRN
jgi:hypothetical protein